MVFTSGTYLIFLVAVFCCYWLLGSRRQQNLLLLMAGYGFYAWWDYRYCSLMVLSTVIDFICGKGCSRASKFASLFLVVSLVANLGLLAIFKYFGFFQESLVAALQPLGITVHPITLKVLLPVGISFYTFQTLSYTIDIYRGKLQPHNSFIDYAAYVSFFPQLVAGPIERASSLLPQFSVPRTFCSASARDGLRQMLWGFFKKLAVADRLAIVVDEIYANPGTFDSPHLWIAAVGFSLQIYCDFSAYSDIAIGTAKLFGFRLTRNFAMPYFSQDFVEFWRRWHITLSTWFRDYVYIPLGGNRAGPTRQLVNVVIVFALSGLWHGAGWNFVIWGLIHGMLVVASSLLRKQPLGVTDTPLGPGLPSVLAVFRALLVFCIACLAWVFFRVTSFPQAMDILYRMLMRFDIYEVTLKTAPSLSVATKLVPVLLLAEFVTREKDHPLTMLEHLPKLVRWLAYLGLIWGTLYYMPEETGEFVYFQF